MVSTNEKVVRLLEEERAAQSQGLTPYDIAIIGRSVRFEIPYAEAELYELERIADVIIGAMNNLKFHAQRRLERDPPTERSIKMCIGSDLRSARQHSRSLTPALYDKHGNVRKR